MNNDNRNLIINLEGITYTYPGSNSTVINNLDLQFYRKDRIGIMAPNGSGKTTFFHIIMGLIKPDSGKIEIFGKSVKKEKDFLGVRKRIGLLFQDADDQLFSPTVLEDVAFGPLNLGKSKEEALDISRKTLVMLGLEGFEERITFKLSGGEKKLVSLATILAMEPEVLLLDEPTTGLDEKSKDRLIDIIKNLDLAHIVISHGYNFISNVADKIYTMEDGKVLLDDEMHVHVHEHFHTVGRQPHKHI